MSSLLSDAASTGSKHCSSALSAGQQMSRQCTTRRPGLPCWLLPPILSNSQTLSSIARHGQTHTPQQPALTTCFGASSQPAHSLTLRQFWPYTCPWHPTPESSPNPQSSTDASQQPTATGKASPALQSCPEATHPIPSPKRASARKSLIWSHEAYPCPKPIACP